MIQNIKRGQLILATIRINSANLSQTFKYEGTVQDIIYLNNGVELIQVKLFTGNGDETFETYCGEGDIEFIPCFSKDLTFSNEDFLYDLRTTYFDKNLIMRVHVREKEKQAKVQEAWITKKENDHNGNPTILIYDINYLLDQVTISGNIYDVVNKAPIWYYLSLKGN